MTNNKAQQSAEKTAEQQQVLRDLLALGKKKRPSDAQGNGGRAQPSRAGER